MEALEIQAPIREPGFLKKGVLLDKFQKYPIETGWYDLQPVKTFMDRTGKPVQVVKLVPHRHQPDGCRCTVCGRSLHDYQPAGFVPRKGYNTCTQVFKCVHCGEAYTVAGPAHDWAVSGHTRTCKRCGASEEYYSSLDEYLDQHDGWSRWEAAMSPLRGIAEKIESLRNSDGGTHHVWDSLPDGSLACEYPDGRVTVRQDGSVYFARKSEYTYRSGVNDWTGEGKVFVGESYEDPLPMGSDSPYWGVAQNQVRYQVDAEYRNKVNSVKAELKRLRADYWSAFEQAEEALRDIIQARNLYNAKSKEARIIKKQADALVLGREIEF